MQISPLSHPEIQNSDSRFSNLLGHEKWLQLPPAIRPRFGKRVQSGVSVAFQGVVTSMKINCAGRMLAHAARLIGGPLPYDPSCVGQPAVVIVNEDIAGNGQFWIRQYGREAGFPQVVHSSKRFAGKTGLEEYIGYGVGMALNVDVRGGALMFDCDHYFLSMFNHRICIPRSLCPIDLEIGHHDLGAGRFRFSMRVRSKLFGQMLTQDAIFEDAKV